MKHYNIKKRLLNIINRLENRTELSNKSDLEIKKLQLENELSEKKLKDYSKQNILEYLKTLLPFFTMLVAIAGLVFTFFTQQKQIGFLQQQHTDDRLSDNIDQLASSTSEASKLISLTRLSIYLDSSYSGYNQQIVDLLINYGESDSSSRIREYIKKMLSIHNPRVALNNLLTRNKEMQKKLI